MGDDIFIVLDGSYRGKLPPGSIVYTLLEAQLLAYQPEEVRRTAHEAKKLGGVITSSMKRIKGGQYV
ncbi:MAG TPA: hypothetical protein VMW50_10225 [Dehalococcoidia bacterium]|nr:hypothetical protein [Dehalococcoidia bacterium]